MVRPFPALALAGIGIVSLALLGFVIPWRTHLPSIEALTEVPAEDPVARLHRHGLLIRGVRRRAPFGRQHRGGPSLMKQAILAAEDEALLPHTGVDYHGVLRAAYSNLVTAARRKGLRRSRAGRAKLFSFPGKRR